MSLFDCLTNAAEGEPQFRDRAEEAQRLFNRLRDDYEPRIGPDAANAQAAEDVKQIMRGRSERKRRLDLLRIQAARRNAQLMAQHRTLNGQANQAAALRIFITGDETSPIQGIDPLAKTLRGFYHSEMDQVLSNFGRNLLGNVRNKARLANVVNELFGKKSGDTSAGELAEAVRSVLDRARRDFNAAGGDIGKIENYGLPMHHSAEKIRAADFEPWRDQIWEDLDWTRIIDFDTDQPFAIGGSRPPKGGRAEAFLQEVFDSITTDGWSKREASFHERGLSVANSRNASRVLHFRDGEAWMRYNDAYGAEDPFTNIVTTLDGYARDTAAMRVLGPNPQAGLTFLSQTAMKAAQETPWDTPSASVSQVSRAARKARAMLDLHSGAAQAPVNGWLGEFLAGTRAVLVSAQLGSAAVSAVTDVGFQGAAARKIGMDFGGVMSRLGKELAGDPANAIRKGLVADQLANVGAGQARFMGEAFTPERAARLSDFVMRASGLTKWTEAGRHAFQLEFMGYLADQSRFSWDAMSPPLRTVLERRGFTAAEWDVIRRADLHDEGGATFMVPHEMRYRTDIPEDQAEDLAFRLMSVIHEQTEFAVPSASLEGQALALDQTRPGTLIGELARSGFMYKTFGASVLFNQTRRLMSFDGPYSRFAYGTAMMAIVTAMGAVSLQMKEILKGRDPRPMNDAKFLGAAILQGGGFGIFGDFLSSEANRFGGGIESTLAGPVAGAAGDVISLGISGVKAAAGQDDHFGRKTVNFLRYNTPVTGIWYWKNAFQRGLFDNLQRLADPEAERAWRQAERRRIQNYGNASFWGPGDWLPSRAPDFRNAISQ
ncbi:hypothetical protein [uncultured Ruegeria sp.]|uniref:hypothetical protein n=1 Tax=uncultured Ruegeria sp. TaxID=259304 RepID=UPI00262DE5C1|nr:hypothetical protein [uncultured Ruegeria sp.]